MAIPTPTIPSSTTTISAVDLRPTMNNKAFYVYSGEITVDTSETTMISVNDIGKRDVLICFEVGPDTASSSSYLFSVKSNGSTIHNSILYSNTSSDFMNELKFILPANTSLEATLKSSSASLTWTVSAYGYYLEAF